MRGVGIVMWGYNVGVGNGCEGVEKKNGYSDGLLCVDSFVVVAFG